MLQLVAFLDCRCFNPCSPPLVSYCNRTTSQSQCLVANSALTLGRHVVRYGPQEYVKGIDRSLAPQAGALQLAQRFHEDEGELSNLPRIPLWVLVQPAYECISPSVQSPAGSPKSSPKSPYSKGKVLDKASLTGSSPRGQSKIPTVRMIK